MVELLAPAGSCESLMAAVNAGADAVYIGGSLFGARAYADNPDEEHLIRGIEYCHLHGRKLYMTINTLLRENELESMLYPFLLPYYLNGADGVIVQDPGVVRFLQEFFPGLEIHASTQMTVTGVYGARLLQNRGITRVVPARELSLGEIRQIIDQTGIEVETFVHGAMCYSYSGQCLFSSMLGGRSGNRGRCAQPCRLPYSVSDGPKRQYLLSMKDMCALDLLPDLIDAGIASFKIEGRMKRPEYTAGVVHVYRKYIDLYLKKGRGGYRIQEEDRLELLDLYNRGGFSHGYYETHNGKNMMVMSRPNHQGTKAACVRSANREKICAEALEHLHRQDILELPDGEERTLSREVKKGELFSLRSCAGRPGRGSVLYRTKNETLLQKLKNRYLNGNIQEKIKGKLRILRDSPAILSLSYLNYTVTVSRDAAESAATSPTSEETIRRQLLKTGNTPFVFDELEIDLDRGLFVSVKALNELRRAAIAMLQERVLESSRRALPPEYTPLFQRPQPHSDSAVGMNVLVTTREQLSAVLSFTCPALDTIYLDSLLFDLRKNPDKAYADAERMIDTVKSREIRCCFSFPPVFRAMDQRFLFDDRMQKLLGEMDGFLLHTVDQLAYAGEYRSRSGKKLLLAADDTLYAYNNRAVSFLTDLGIDRRTLPSELNMRELQNLNQVDSELNVYGYQPLMQSAQCLLKNTSGCSRNPGITYLRDRKNAEFPVLNRCMVCCNTIYNSLPLQLKGCREELLQLSPGFWRLNFTLEDGRQTAHIFGQYYRYLCADAAEEGCLEGTRGHFRRGVE